MCYRQSLPEGPIVQELTKANTGCWHADLPNAACRHCLNCLVLSAGLIVEELIKASMAGAAGKPDRNIPKNWQQIMDFDFNMQRQRELAAAGNVKLSRAFQPIHHRKGTKPSRSQAQQGKAAAGKASGPSQAQQGEVVPRRELDLGQAQQGEAAAQRGSASNTAGRVRFAEVLTSEAAVEGLAHAEPGSAAAGARQERHAAVVRG